MRKISAALIVCILFIFPSLTTGDSVEYLYDDAGRLTRVVKDADGIIYKYDEAGNLISIIKAAISAVPPVLDSIIPEVLFIGSTAHVIINGQNLITAKDVASGSPSISLTVSSISDTEIEAEIAVSSSAAPGTENITVTTSYGSASIPVTLSSSRLIFSPGQLVLPPGGSGDITVTISPSLISDLTIAINNSDPSVVSTPELVTIPAGGPASFTVNGLMEGAATINSRTVVFVTDSSGFPPGEEIKINAGPVSIYIEQPSGSPTAASLPISVYIDTPSGDSSIQSVPVSVYIQTPSSNSTTVSFPVSVMVATGETITDAAAVSLPVSIRMEAPAGDASIAALPVSIYIEPLASDSTAMSLPVSIYMQTSVDVLATAAANPISIYIQTQTGDTVTVSSLVSVGSCPEQPVRVIGAASGSYAALQDAYNAASSGDIIQSHAGLLTGDLNINQEKTVTIEGGYSCDFTTVIGKTSFRGLMTISNGVLTIENFILEE